LTGCRTRPDEKVANALPIAGYNNTLLLHSERTSDKPLPECAERRHLPCSTAPCRMKTVIVGGDAQAVDVLWVSTGFFVRVIDIAVALSVLDFQDPGAVFERVTAAAKERQLSHNSLIAYRRTWLKIIA